MRRSKKNKILRFNPNGLKIKDRSYNQIKTLLNKNSKNTREVIKQQSNIENTIREYLENKKYTIYLCRINYPLRLTIMTSPVMLEPDLKQLKYDFGLNDYELEIETSDHVGQYYFR